MFVNFNEETRHLLKQAEKEREDLKHPYVGSEHLFLSVLKESKLTDILKKHKITYKKFKDKLISLVGVGSKKSDFILYTPLLKRVLENAVIEAREENNKIVNPEIVIISILDEEDGIAYSILKSLKVNVDKLYGDLKNKNINRKFKKKKLLLEDIGTNLTKLAKENKLDPVIGRDNEINKTIEILLRRKKNNPILIGPAGVGKTAIVEGIANLMISGKCPSFLENKRIISLNIFSLVSGTKYRGEFEEKMKTVIKELEENDDIILFIDEVHTMVGAGGAEGAIDASNILKPALARGMIRIIGATTQDEYKKYIEPDAALARRFQMVNVEEPKHDDVIKILTEIKPLYEKYHNIRISNDLINEIVDLSEKYLSNRFEPDRSIDILDEVCAKSSILESYDERKKRNLVDRLNKIKKEKINALSVKNFKRAYDLKIEENKIMSEIDKIIPNRKNVNKEDVLNVIKNKGNIKGINLINEDKGYYESLEEKLNNKIVGQELNVKKVVRSLKRKNIINKKKSYSILITGNSGSGKSFFAKTYLNEIIDSKSIIKIDLAEYKEYHMISKLIGTTAGYLGYDNKNHVFEKVRTNPSSAIMVSNFDKACYEVQDLFIKILADNYIEDAAGKKIDFSNTIIIFTCEESDSTMVGFNTLSKEDLYLPDKLLSNVSLRIKMKKLNEEDKIKIINRKVGELIKEYKDFNIKVSDKYIFNLYNKYKNKNKLSIIISKVIEALENEIIDLIMDGKKEIKVGFNVAYSLPEKSV